MSNRAFAITDTTIHENLSPPLSVQLEEFEDSYILAAICALIEQHVLLDDESAIGNICSWVNKSPNSGIQITPGINEVIIDIPEKVMAVRYFIPGKALVVTPFNDVSGLRTKVITPRLYRQVLHRTKAIQADPFAGRDLLDMGDDEIIDLIDPRQNELKKHVISVWNYARAFAEKFGIQTGSLEWNMLRGICLAHDIGGVLGHKPTEEIERALLVLADDPGKHKKDYVGRTVRDVLSEFQNLGITIEEDSPMKTKLEALCQPTLEAVLEKITELGQPEKYKVDYIHREPEEVLRELEAKGVVFSPETAVFVEVADHANNSLRKLKAEGITVPEEVGFVISNHMSGFSEDRLKILPEEKRDRARVLFACFNAADVFECGNNYYKQKGGYYKHEGAFEDPATTLKFMDPVVGPYISDIGQLASAGGLDAALDHSRSKLKHKERSSLPGDQFVGYLDKNLSALEEILGENKPAVLLRVPVEVIENTDRHIIRVFLEAFFQAPNAYIELFYMSGIGEEVSGNIYETYGITRKTLPGAFRRNRKNTVTLFPAMKGEEITGVTVRTRLGALDIKPIDTILSPIGLQNDPAGLVRSTVLGLRIMGFARELDENKDLKTDPEFIGRVQLATMETYKQVCDASDRKELVGLTPQDIIALATGDTINDILGPLRKLIKLLPITPIDTEELKRIYEHARQVLLAA